MIGKTDAVVPVIVPIQASIVVGTGGVTEHSPAASARIGTAGGVSSLMVTF
ncbi:hypothetical protein D3C87_985740 [compost metagenome]